MDITIDLLHTYILTTCPDQLSSPPILATCPCHLSSPPVVSTCPIPLSWPYNIATCPCQLCPNQLSPYLLCPRHLHPDHLSSPPVLTTCPRHLPSPPALATYHLHLFFFHLSSSSEQLLCVTHCEPHLPGRNPDGPAERNKCKLSMTQILAHNLIQDERTSTSTDSVG